MRINSFAVEILLAEKNMTKTELANRASTTKQTISAALRRGTCEPKTLGKISRALNVDISAIMVQEG